MEILLQWYRDNRVEAFPFLPLCPNVAVWTDTLLVKLEVTLTKGNRSQREEPDCMDLPLPMLHQEHTCLPHGVLVAADSVRITTCD